MVELGKLNWKKVVTSDGIEIGNIQGGEANTKTWQITHVHVGVNDSTMKAFGLKRPYLGQMLVCLPVNFIQTVNDNITLNKSFEELKNEKECREFTANSPH